MYATLTTLIDRLDSPVISGTEVIHWGSPVLSFGNLSNARVATVGINPSNREFVDEKGEELQGTARRFHTLKSLGIKSWSDVDARHIRLIVESCYSYFSGNPYDRWFRKLDQIILGTNASFYDSFHAACHLDLIPFATINKWAELNNRQHSLLISISGDTLGLLLKDSPVRILILNGESVVQQFQNIACVNLEKYDMPIWSLHRRSKSDVKGIAYRGIVNTLSGVALGHDVLVLGYNHNIQSSFGVTSKVVHLISKWIGQVYEEEFS
jgi:hypothetical protein